MRSLTINQKQRIMKQTYYVMNSMEVYSQSELTPEKQRELSRQSQHVIAIVFDCSSKKECRDRYFKSIGM